MNIAIVTGASGFIGSALVGYLLKRNYKVYALVREEKKFPKHMVTENLDNLNIIESDYHGYSKLQEQIHEDSIDFFFHMAWEFRAQNLYDYNVQINNIWGACEAVKAASTLNVRRFVFMNSFFAYKKDFYIDTSKRENLDYCSIYGESKKDAKELTKIIAHNEGVEHVSILLSNIFGVGDNSNRAINTMIRKMLNGEDVPVIEGKYLYDYIYIDDAVEGILAVAERGIKDEEYYLGNNALRSFKDFILDMRTAVNPNANLVFGAFPDTSFIDFTQIDLYKIYRDTGFVPKVNIIDCFKKTAEWLEKKDE